MSKRIKRVFGSAEQVLHLWANQAQSDARCSNVFFEGKDCYSYGYHYKLGTLVNFKGHTVALVNVSGYSVTTAKHISWARSAASHLPVICVDSATGFSVVKGLARAKAAIEEMLAAQLRKRSFWSEQAWTAEYSPRNEVTKHNRLCDRLKTPKYKVKVTAKYISQYNERFKACRAKQSVKEKENEARREAERIQRAKDAQADLAAWKTGGPKTWNLTAIKPQQIRINGDLVETTGGAEVPLNEALSLLRRLESGEAKPGDKVGGFEFTGISMEGLVCIGCHEISLAEAKQVLTAIPNNVIPFAAS